MAVRDRNMFIWQAYVLASTIISVIILILMFMVWRNADYNAKALASTKEELATAQKNGTAALEKLKRMLAITGPGAVGANTTPFKEDPELGPVEKEYAKIESLFPGQTAQDQKTFSNVPPLLLETIRIRNQELASLRAENRAFQLKMDKEIEDHRRARETAELAQQKAEKDLADARIAHKQQIEAVNRIKDETVEQFAKNKAHFDSQLKEQTTKIAKLESEGTEKSETILKQVDRIQRFENPDYATAQGRITMVTDGATRAHINLGSRHGLRKGTTFSILDASDTQISKATPKARMIVQSVGDDSASGEIFFGDDAIARRHYFGNPAVEGDQIYSPVFAPGRKVGFALVGRMDINGDFQDDAQQVRGIIEAAGAAVDAEMPAKGGEKGKITRNTNFLVIGSDVDSIANSPNGTEKAKEYSKFIGKAKSNGLVEISIEKLIGYLKVDESTRMIPLGNKTQASDFKVRNQISPRVSDGTVSEIFTQGKKQ